MWIQSNPWLGSDAKRFQLASITPLLELPRVLTTPMSGYDLIGPGNGGGKNHLPIDPFLNNYLSHWDRFINNHLFPTFYIFKSLIKLFVLMPT